VHSQCCSGFDGTIAFLTWVSDFLSRIGVMTIYAHSEKDGYNKPQPFKFLGDFDDHRIFPAI
jgi:hypothetical protein